MESDGKSFDVPPIDPRNALINFFMNGFVVFIVNGEHNLNKQVERLRCLLFLLELSFIFHEMDPVLLQLFDSSSFSSEESSFSSESEEGRGHPQSDP